MTATTTRKVIKAPRKKSPIPRRPKTGLLAVPLTSWDACKYYFQQELDKKEVIDVVKTWVRKNFSKDDAKAIMANPEYHFTLYTHLGAAIHWTNSGMEFDDEHKRYPQGVREYYERLIEPGKEIIAAEEAKAAAAAIKAGDPSAVTKLTPLQLLMKKVESTIMVDLDTLEDEWIDKKTTTIDIYTKFQNYQLKGSAVQPVQDRLKRWLLEYEDAYFKRCDQAVEGYSHIKRPELKRRIDAIKTMLEDLNKVKAATTATRTPRVPKTRAADKQISRLQFLKSSEEYKLMSINPIQIPGSMRLYTFNEKTRTLSEYISDSTKGFEVKGTTVTKFDSDRSRSVRLRKPDQFLAMVLSKTVKQIENEWSKLTTKSSTPNGRINKDTVLLRVMDQ